MSIPSELLEITGTQVKNIPYIKPTVMSGIYFLCMGGEIGYIGQSTSVVARAMSHSGNPKRPFDSIYYIECDPKQLDAFEGLLIRFYKPKWNGPPLKAMRGEIWEFNTLKSLGVPVNLALLYMDDTLSKKCASAWSVSDWRETQRKWNNYKKKYVGEL